MTREEFDEQSLIDRIENRINAEYRKHKNLDWAKIAAIKIAHEILSTYGSSLPPAEGAEDILKNRFGDQYSILTPLGIKTIIVAMQDYATLHAQRIAEKMVAERLSDELIKYDKYIGSRGWIDNYEDWTAITSVAEYLKSREK